MITVQDVYDVIEKEYKRQDSLMIIGGKSKCRLACFYNSPDENVLKLTQKIAGFKDRTLKDFKSSITIDLTEKGIRPFKSKMRIIRVKEHFSERDGGHIQVSVFEAEGIRISFNTSGVRAGLELSRKPVLNFLINTDTGFFYGTDREGKRKGQDLVLSRYMDRLMYHDGSLRAMLTGLLRLSGGKNHMLKDLAESVDEYHIAGCEVSINTLARSHDKRRFFRRLAGRDLRVNFNRFIFFEGMVINAMAGMIPDTELPLLIQLVKKGKLESGIKNARDRIIEDSAYADSDYMAFLKSEIFESVSTEYYRGRILKNPEEEHIFSDLINMCRMLEGTKVSMKYRSFSAVRRFHDEMTDLLNRDRMWFWDAPELLPDECLVPKDSVFERLRSILPPEFEWIRERGRLMEEGRKQHNCVASYETKIKGDACAVYHWENGGKKYTIEFKTSDGKFRISQMLGTCNEPALKEDEIKVSEYLTEEEEEYRYAGIESSSTVGIP